MNRSKPKAPDTGDRYVIFAASFAIVGGLAALGFLILEAMVYG
jgi:hypothetical protein